MPDFRPTYVKARDILLAHEPYRSMPPHEIGMRIDVPLHLGLAAVLDEPGVFFSWSFIERGTGAFERMARGICPMYEDWSVDGPVLWLMDVAATPGTSGMQVGRAINHFMVSKGIVPPGQRAAFRRHSGRRFGYATAQEAR